MASKKEYREDPRNYALMLVEEGVVDARTLLVAALNYMSWSEIAGMLDSNELSPRWVETED